MVESKPATLHRETSKMLRKQLKSGALLLLGLGLLALGLVVLRTQTDTMASVVTDIDGNVYKTVTIGNQVWMAKDLGTTRYSNGDAIGTTSPATLDTSSEHMPKYQ
jgi:hypothetical protein